MSGSGLGYGITRLLTVITLAGLCQSREPVAQAARSAKLVFSEEWHSLGPFRIGTREAVWGADPLEAVGGFHNLAFNPQDQYSSSLATNASISWQRPSVQLKSEGQSAVAEVTVDFPHIDWHFAQSVYGWAALQYQAWARGHLVNHDFLPVKVSLLNDQILELWVNDDYFFGGDLYGFQRAAIVLTLRPGINVIDVRLVRDVRAMGGQSPPSITVKLAFHILDCSVEIPEHGINFPDLVGTRLAGSYASVILRNNGDDWVAIQEVSVEEAYSIALSQNSNSRRAESKTVHAHLVESQPVRIAPGQSRPVALRLSPGELSAAELIVEVRYVHHGVGKGSTMKLQLEVELKRRGKYEPHKITFQHPSGAISYGVLKPPPWPRVVGEVQGLLPVLLNLHGAGLEADSYQVRHQLDSIPDLAAWTLFPTGMSPWSGDDWHTWGFADVRAAISAIPQCIGAANWAGPGVALDRWLVSGHSNGGQGTWFVATHMPDNVIAAAPVSGYLSIENYVPYTMWTEAEPLQNAALHIARSNFRHELMYSNLHAIPILQQHGSLDDNVPPYHSRLIYSLLKTLGSMSEYVELAGKGHWFDGAMETEALKDFYVQNVGHNQSTTLVPHKFVIVYPNSHDMGSRYGIEVDQLESPDTVGRIDGTTFSAGESNTWWLKTSNVRRFHLVVGSMTVQRPRSLILDDNNEKFDLSTLPVNASFLRLGEGMWVLEHDNQWRTLGQRYGRQRGALDSILRTDGPFQIVSWFDEHTGVSTQISRNMLQYFGADSQLLGRAGYDRAIRRGGNVITIVVGTDIPEPSLHNFPLQIRPGGIYLDRPDPGRPEKVSLAPGLGAIYLRPLPDERLELVVWGIDEVGLRQAARLIPTLTGAGQPDFIVLDDKARWRGHAGALALGFFDSLWNISKASFIR